MQGRNAGARDWLELPRVLPLLGLALIFLYSAIRIDQFLTVGNLLLLLTHAAYVGILAAGLTFCLAANCFDISQGSIVSLGAVMSALALRGGLDPWFVVLLTFGLSSGIGLVNGWLVGYAGVDSLIATLGTNAVLSGLAFTLNLGESVPVVTDQARVIAWLAEGHIGVFPVPVLLLVLVALIAWFVESVTVFGQHMRAVGGNLRAAVEAGVNVRATHLAVFSASAVTAGVAGLVIMARMGAGNPVVGPSYGLDAFAATFIGIAMYFGQARVLGTMVGVALISLLVYALNLAGVNPFLQDVVRGLVVVVVASATTIRRVSRARG